MEKCCLYIFFIKGSMLDGFLSMLIVKLVLFNSCVISVFRIYVNLSYVEVR